MTSVVFVDGAKDNGLFPVVTHYPLSVEAQDGVTVAVTDNARSRPLKLRIVPRGTCYKWKFWESLRKEHN